MDLYSFVVGFLTGPLLILIFLLFRALARTRRRVPSAPPSAGPGGQTSGDRSPLHPSPSAGSAGAEVPIPEETKVTEAKARVITKSA